MREILIKPDILKYKTFAAFAEDFRIGEGDLILTTAYLKETYIDPVLPEAKCLIQEEFGLGEPSEEMIEKMREKEYVMEIKDVLMDYIKSIEPKYRLQLLEIMESGLQYEKTRGNMKDTVIEKVEKVFEEEEH